VEERTERGSAFHVDACSCWLEIPFTDGGANCPWHHQVRTQTKYWYCQLRLSNSTTFVIPRTYTLSDLAFPVAGLRLRISLSSNLRQSDLTLQQFRRTLQTDVFVWLTETRAPSDLLFVACYTNVLPYLLTYLLLFQPPIVPRVRHVGDARNFHDYPEQNWQKWCDLGAEVHISSRLFDP